MISSRELMRAFRPAWGAHERALYRDLQVLTRRCKLRRWWVHGWGWQYAIDPTGAP